jgi:transcriptional regulator with XRE-family HTH domain
VDAVRIGLSLRALRLRRQLRQVDVAGKAGVSRGTISNIERGQLQPISMEMLRRVAAVLGADLDVQVRWHGAELDRLLDEGHARLVDVFTGRLRAIGWDVAIEATFSVYGERGSIDVLAFHPATRSLLVVEVKTVVPDLQSMIATLDRKTRLGPGIAADRGWSCGSVSRLLVVERGSTSRDRVRRMGAAFATAFPQRGAVVRPWLVSPSDAISGLMFVRSANPGSVTVPLAGRQRVRTPRTGRSASLTGDPHRLPAVLDAAGS